MLSRSLMLAFSLVVAALLPTIWVVDATNGPGTNFTDLPAAVAAAQTGDVIFVRPGTYKAFECSGKALSIRGSGAATTIIAISPHILHPVTAVDSVPAGSTFYIDGISFAPDFSLLNGTAIYETPGLRLAGAGSAFALTDVTV